MLASSFEGEGEEEAEEKEEEEKEEEEARFARDILGSMGSDLPRLVVIRAISPWTSSPLEVQRFVSRRV